ncbi:MAG: signal recognition particle protein, partial [Alphaproteobacteria bacterium]
MQQMKKMGGMGAMLKLLPGLGSMASQLENAGIDDSIIRRQEALIFSMTTEERENPDLLNAKRRIRIANGSGTSVQDINKLTKQLEQMQKMMKQMRKMGTGKMMGMMNKMMGGKMDDLELMAQSMDPDALGADMGSLGPNPFASGGNAMSGMNALENLLGGKKK